MSRIIVGIFSNTDDSENAIEKLENKQYNPKDISIIMKSRDRAKALAEKTGADVGSSTLSGATTGVVIGALAGLLVSAGVIPGLGALFIGGPLVASLGLTGAAAATVSGATTGALAGGVMGLLGGIGIAGSDATEYEESIKQGGILVAIPARLGNENEVRGILQECGADKIRSIETDHVEPMHERRATT